MFMFHTHIYKGPSEFGAMKVPSTSTRPPPSFPKLILLPEGPGLRTCAFEQPSVTFGRTKTISFAPEGVGLRVCAPGRPFVSFGLQKVLSFVPKVKAYKLVLLSDPSSPSSTLTLFLLEPCKRVREHFRGWELDPEVQSPTVAPRGRGPKPTVRTLVNEEDCV